MQRVFGLGVQPLSRAMFATMDDSGQAPDELSALAISLHLAHGSPVPRGRGAIFQINIR